MDIQDFIVNRDQHMRPLEYDLSENFNELLRYMQDMGILDNVPVGVTSESEIVSISDAYPAPPRALNVYGKSTQNGTPTPDAPVPILSVDDLSLVMAGKNLLNTSSYGTQTLNGLTFTRNADGAIVVNGTATANTVVYPLAGNITIIEGTYTLSGCPAGGSSTTYELNLGGNLIRDYGSGGTRTISANTTTQLRIVVKSGVTCNNLTFYPQLEVGSTATQYTPYVTLTTAPDLLPEGTDLRSLPDGTRDTLNLSYLRPSTRAGWAWYSREVTQRVHHEVITEFDQRNVANQGGYRSTRGEKRISSTVVNKMSGGFCSHAPWTNSSSSTATYVSRICAYRSYNTNNILCVVLTMDETDESFTTLENMNAWLATHGPIAVDCELATPVTTTLDPIELPTLPAPNCTVWCDGGSATPTLMLEYVRNANAAIAELSEAIADIVSG